MATISKVIISSNHNKKYVEPSLAHRLDSTESMCYQLKDSKERQRWHREQTVLRCQLEALQAERDAAEQDLTALYDLHVQAARAQTRHVLQVSWERQRAGLELVPRLPD